MPGTREHNVVSITSVISVTDVEPKLLQIYLNFNSRSESLLTVVEIKENMESGHPVPFNTVWYKKVEFSLVFSRNIGRLQNSGKLLPFKGFFLPPKPKRDLKVEIQLQHKNSLRLEEIGCCTRTVEVKIKHQQCYHKVFVNKQAYDRVYYSQQIIVISQGQDIYYKVYIMDSEIIRTKCQQVLCLYFQNVYI